MESPYPLRTGTTSLSPPFPLHSSSSTYHNNLLQPWRVPTWSSFHLMLAMNSILAGLVDQVLPSSSAALLCSPLLSSPLPHFVHSFRFSIFIPINFDLFTLQYYINFNIHFSNHTTRHKFRCLEASLWPRGGCIHFSLSLLLLLHHPAFIFAAFSALFLLHHFLHFSFLMM